MLRSIVVQRFKSLVDLHLDLGRVNVFVGANGSGKSNILEAVGVLGAAASGRVDDETLQHRGVRPGVPQLYKTQFPKLSNRPHIFLAATADSGASYEVSLWNPLANPSPAWRFKTENLRGEDGRSLVTRSPMHDGKGNQEQGKAALATFELAPDAPAQVLMGELRGFSIHCPNTPSLRGLVQDLQSREPVGLAGGRLPEAVDELLRAGRRDDALEAALDSVRDLIDWADGFSAAPSVGVPLSPSAARSRLVIRFVDRFMAKGRDVLTGYDASEGALYVLYCAALALHSRAPRVLAIDNVDQALNPVLAKRLTGAMCAWLAGAVPTRQVLLTAHNPAALDGLPLDDDECRLFAVDRDSRGHTTVRRIDLEAACAARPSDDWTLSRMWMSGLLGGVPNV